ncbi:beta-lactamase class A [Crossiella equi]|uniref:Beta-lactamase n=1 Tax=Crossiella equi TaxID=130796 RepID=A0ABS5AKN7_9PSEU|nr:serine hydrolase [Crossiella equi]MBP2477133.1 beta-lactamase class A [Crossiella equi]
MDINRRRALGLGTVAAAGAVLGSPMVAAAQTQVRESAPADDDTTTPADSAAARRRIERVYKLGRTWARGTWSAIITVTDPDGTPVPAVAEEADRVVDAQSVNKLAVATAVLDKVDRGLLKLDQRVEVTADIVLRDGDGIFAVDGAYPSSVTLGHAIANLLVLSDNTAVRLCGSVCGTAEVNEILAAKGFTHTRVKPSTRPDRFFLGWTTPRETHDLLRRLTAGTLLSETSTTYMLNALRCTSAFNDGVRLRLSTPERLRVATKAGWFATDRHEAGLVFDTAGKPIVCYSLFATGEFRGDATANNADFTTNHPAIAARSVLGRTMMDSVIRLTNPSARTHRAPAYRPGNGG